MSKNISSLSGCDGKELDDALWERLASAAAGSGTPDDDTLTKVAQDFHRRSHHLWHLFVL
ncbi:MAG: hypothetical protein IPL52_05990 [Flavobacteriales bacterium]|nr:hypothetical protein [Flavobacteriales bacterium]